MKNSGPLQAVTMEDATDVTVQLVRMKPGDLSLKALRESVAKNINDIAAAAYKFYQQGMRATICQVSRRSPHRPVE